MFTVAFTSHRQNTRLRSYSFNNRNAHAIIACLLKVAMKTVQDVIQRVRAEYLDLPGMRLKAEQVQRLCGVERSVCQMVLDTLVDARFLCVKADGQYARLTEGLFPRPQSANADLRTDTCSKKVS